MKKKNLILYSNEEDTQSIRCARVKTEQQEGLDLDYITDMKCKLDSMAFEVFVTLVKAMLLSFFTTLKNCFSKLKQNSPNPRNPNRQHCRDFLSSSYFVFDVNEIRRHSLFSSCKLPKKNI